MPYASHLTPVGGWVEFHPAGRFPETTASASDPQRGAPMLPSLRPLAWFRFSTAEEQSWLLKDLEPACRPQTGSAKGGQTDFVYTRCPQWWRVDDDAGQETDCWRGRRSAPASGIMVAALQNMAVSSGPSLAARVSCFQ